MANISVLSLDQACKESRAVYDEFNRRMQFPAPPNFITTQGHSSHVARGTWELIKNVLVSGDIERWKKEIIFVAISHERNCRYCLAAHTACCRMLGVDVELFVGNWQAMPDPVLRDMILFAMKTARDPQGLTSDDYDVLRAYGLSQSQIMELISMAALAVYANIIADATAMEADKVFETVGPKVA
ncbi:MAG: carboxymuconolactone decarboxylase family protein [Rhizobiales bacterium]|nr:carboxymuconolactone decarboxylase family protein [Hyphomicrobiales bacterium]